MSRKITGTVAITLVAGLGLAGCSASSTASSSSDSSSAHATTTSDTSTLNAQLYYAPTTFDPALASAQSDVFVTNLGFDTLLHRTDSGYIGGLATKWKTVSSTEYELTIRKNATCADGTAITPSIVAASLKYLATNSNATAKTTTTQAFGPGTPTFTAEDSANTLKISLSKPYSDVLGGLTLGATGIICPAGLKDPKGLAAGTVAGAWSGPYTLASVKAGISATYKLRSDYDAWPDWPGLKGTPAKTINLSVSSDSNTYGNLLKSGGLDVARVEDANYKQFLDTSKYTATGVSMYGYSLAFNEASGSLMANEKVRKAVAQAINRESFNKAALYDMGKTQTTVTSANYQCALDGSSLVQKYDPTSASKVLKGKTIRLVLMSGWNEASDDLAESLRAAGATVKVSAPDPAEWLSTMRTKPDEWDIGIVAESTSTGMIGLAIANFVGSSFLDGGQNYTSSDNTKGYAAYQAGVAASSASTKCKEFKAAQRSILKRTDIAPLAYDRTYVIARKGFVAPIYGHTWNLSTMRISK